MLQRPDATVLHVLLEDPGRGATGLEKVFPAARHPIGPDEDTDGQALGHRADPRGLEPAASLAPVERVGPDHGTVGPANGVSHEPVGLAREGASAPGVGAAKPAFQADQAVPGDIRGVVGLAEDARSMYRNTRGIELHGVEEQAVTVDVVAQGLSGPGGRYRLQRVVEPEADRFVPERPRRRPQRLEGAGPRTPGGRERHSFETSQLPIAR